MAYLTRLARQWYTERANGEEKAAGKGDRAYESVPPPGSRLVEGDMAGLKGAEFGFGFGEPDTVGGETVGPAQHAVDPTLTGDRQCVVGFQGAEVVDPVQVLLVEFPERVDVHDWPMLFGTGLPLGFAVPFNRREKLVAIRCSSAHVVSFSGVAR